MLAIWCLGKSDILILQEALHKSSSQVQSSYLHDICQQALQRKEVSCNSPSVWEVSSHYQGHLLLIEFLDGNLQRICFSFQIHQSGCIAAGRKSASAPPNVSIGLT